MLSKDWYTMLINSKPHFIHEHLFTITNGITLPSADRIRKVKQMHAYH